MQPKKLEQHSANHKQDFANQTVVIMSKLCENMQEVPEAKYLMDWRDTASQIFSILYMVLKYRIMFLSR